MADDDIREGAPRKKRSPPPDDEDDRPRSKKRPIDDDEDEAPRKKKKRPREEDEEEEDDGGQDLGSSPLSAIIPVGGSIFALMSLWLSVLSLMLGIASLILLERGHFLSILLPAFWPIAILSGVISFFTHKSKASYGSIVGNMRAILGILIGLAAMVLHLLLIVWFFNPNALR